MAGPRKSRMHPRRRRDDTGEEEGSATGDLEDESLSEGSAGTGVDEIEQDGSEASADDEQVPSTPPNPQNTGPENADAVRTASVPTDAPVAPFQVSTDTDAMRNGLASVEKGLEELNFDETEHLRTSSKSPVGIPKAPRHETQAQRARREHQEYLKERDSNPAFIPNRGGFFLHDDRSAANPGFQARPYGRGRGRATGQDLYTNRGVPEPVEKQWAHDLHDGHENPADPSSTKQPIPQSSAVQNQVPTSNSSAPNRSFSFTTVLGNVTVQVSLPGMLEGKAVSNVVKKNHTLLPQHRPPLRRDKPVRISIPDDQPRYIFPSTERSFIFIPRAMRPNQQPYMRGRGRGSFQGSRRTSIFGASSYTPSIAMSRKSSLGGPMRDNLRSPTGSTISRAAMPGFDYGRPVVRLPTAAGMPGSLPMSATVSGTQTPIHGIPMNGSMAYGFHSNSIPMHQPRPQKAVSVADIESPARMIVKAPQQQQEQPFHQQMPNYINNEQYPQQSGQNGTMGPGSGPQGTPLSHIPEGAVYANPFQPVTSMQPMFYPNYGNGQPFYPQMSNGMQFGPMMPIAMAPAFAPAPGHMGQALPMAVPPDSNGMVYYYDPGQYAAAMPGQAQFQSQGPVPVQPMMNPQASYYYPPTANVPFYGTPSDRRS